MHLLCMHDEENHKPMSKNVLMIWQTNEPNCAHDDVSVCLCVLAVCSYEGFPHGDMKASLMERKAGMGIVGVWL